MLTVNIKSSLLDFIRLYLPEHFILVVSVLDFIYYVFKVTIQKKIDVEIEKVLGNMQMVSTGEVINQEMAKKTQKIRE